MHSSLVAWSRGYPPVVMHGLLIAVASLAVGSVVAAPGLWSTGSVVVAHRLSCPAAYGIFPVQGSNQCLLHWQVDYLLLSHQGGPRFVFDEDLVIGIERDINHNNMKIKLPLLSACHILGTLETTQ